MGSIGIAAWIAKLAFLALLTWGATSGELRPKRIAVFLVLGVAAWVGLPYVPQGRDYVTSALALIDIALVFAVFKGDVRITERRLAAGKPPPLKQRSAKPRRSARAVPGLE